MKNVRRLLHLLSTTVCKARAEIVALLQKYYSLLFTDTPTKVHKAMVDFNRWLTEVLADTHSEGIEWGPSYGETPWLALEEQQPQRDEALAFDNASTFQLLRTACEYFMVRCDSLQQSNARLAMQLEELKTQLKEALIRAFESQHALEREREVSALQDRRLVMGVQIGDHLAQQRSHGGRPINLHQQITSAFCMLDAVSTVPREGTEEAPVDESTPTSVLGRDSNELEVDDALANEGVESGVATPVNQEKLQPALPSTNVKVLPEVFRPSKEQLDSDPASSSVFELEPLTSSDDFDYQKLTTLRSSEEKNCSWYRHALHTLKEKRKQRRKASGKAADAPPVTKFTTSAVCKEAPSLDAQEFVQLVSTRNSTEDGEDSTWYRRALQHLKEERKRRVSLHNRAGSFSSTISIVD